MTPFNRPRDGADQLNDYLDDLAMGEPAPRSDINADLARTVSQVHAGGDGLAANPRLKSQIWEDLMSSSYAADAGNVAAPIRSVDQIEPSRSGWMPTFTRDRSRGGRFAWLVAAVAVFALLGGVLYTAMRPDNPVPGAPNNNFAFMAPGDATPGSSPMAWPGNIEYPPAEECTVPSLSLEEITGILTHSYWGMGALSSSQRDLPLTQPNNVTLPPPLPGGGPVDSETIAAIKQIHRTYVACQNAGSIRQQYWLFSNDGIARALIPNGTPYFYNIALIGTEPNLPGAMTSVTEFSDFRLLPDGRVAAFFDRHGGRAVGSLDEMAVNYYIFVEHNGNWYIDDFYCGQCG